MQSPGDVLCEGMSNKSSGLANQVPLLQTMAADIKPILDTFNNLLNQPYLQDYSASPGATLNVLELSRSLKDRYTSTQTSLYNVVNKTRAFAITHEVFLKQQRDAADGYQQDWNSTSKQRTAVTVAKKVVMHTKTWATIMRNQSDKTRTAVHLMREGLSNVGTQPSKIAGQTTGREDEMSRVNAAISDIKTIADKFGNVEKMVGTIAQFWGSMFDAARSLKGMDDATAIQIGERILQDKDAIEESLDVTRKMNRGCETYLAALNMCGIGLPELDDDDED